MIQVNHLTKTYRVSRRDGGLMQAIKALGKRETQEIRALDDLSFTIADGERIAQMVIARHEQIEWQPVEVLGETERGAGGFGHTGV